MDKARDEARQQRAKNASYYSALLGQDYSNRADYNALMNRQKEMLNDAYRRARATNVVAGGSDAALAMQQQGINNSVAQTTSNAGARSAASKEAIAGQAIRADNAFSQNEQNAYADRAQQIADAAGQVGSAMGAVAGADKEDWMTKMLRMQRRAERKAAKGNG